jgi:hypothetical protein
LKQNFQEHRAQFATLGEMANADRRVVRIASDFTWLRDNSSWPRADVGFSESRWNDYRRLFRELEIQHGMKWKEDVLLAICWVPHGLLSRDDRESGYAYWFGGRRELETRLGEAWRRAPEALIPLEGGWYSYSF